MCKILKSNITGIIGTGKIGLITAKILNGFSPEKLLAYDVYESVEAKQLGCVYKPLDAVLAVITTHASVCVYARAPDTHTHTARARAHTHTHTHTHDQRTQSYACIIAHT